MPDLTARLLGENFEVALQQMLSIEFRGDKDMLADAIRALHARLAMAERDAARRQEFIAGCQQIIGTHDNLQTAITGILMQVAKARRELATAKAKAEGAAEELERIYAGKGSSTEFDPEYLLRRAAAIRKGIADQPPAPEAPTPDEITALKKRVAELEKRLKAETEYKLIDSCPDVERTDLGETIAPKGNPFKRIYYYGGSWCNVWADDKGIHWEECK